MVPFIPLVTNHPPFPSSLAGYRLSQLIGSTLALDYLRAGERSPEDITFAYSYYHSRIRRPPRFNLSHLQLFIREFFGGKPCDEQRYLCQPPFLTQAPPPHASVPVADIIALTGDDSRDIRCDWNRSLRVHKQRIGPRNRCGTFDVLVASMGVARILLPDDDIPRVDLYLHERARCCACCTG